MMQRKWWTVPAALIVATATIGGSALAAVHASSEDAFGRKDGGAMDLASRDSGAMELRSKDAGATELMARGDAGVDFARDSGALDLFARKDSGAAPLSIGR